MSDLTEQDIPAGIAPRSEQLNADDLVANPVTVTIKGVTLHDDKDQPWWVDLEEYPKKPYKPCLTMRRLMIAAMGKIPKRWAGQRMTLYRDPQVQNRGETVGGIRISHFSSLSEPLTVRLTSKRGIKAKWVACPLETLSPEEQEYITEATRELNETATLEELKAHGFILKTKSKAVQDALRPMYAKRQEALK